MHSTIPNQSYYRSQHLQVVTWLLCAQKQVTVAKIAQVPCEMNNFTAL